MRIEQVLSGEQEMAASPSHCEEDKKNSSACQGRLDKAPDRHKVLELENRVILAKGNGRAG